MTDIKSEWKDLAWSAEMTSFNLKVDISDGVVIEEDYITSPDPDAEGNLQLLDIKNSEYYLVHHERWGTYGYSDKTTAKEAYITLKKYLNSLDGSRHESTV